MSRTEEKQQAMLNRYSKMKKDQEKGVATRPWLASECSSLADGNKWRLQIIKEISRKISDIQNAALGEYRIRELNDQINKLIREKSHWERRIVELGGPDYAAQAAKDPTLAQGVEAYGARGYKYFGQARNLPGVREVLEKPIAGPRSRTRYELFRGVTPEYYGFRDEDDNILAMFEAKAEADVIRDVRSGVLGRGTEGAEDAQIPADELEPDEALSKMSAEELVRAVVEFRKRSALERLESLAKKPRRE